MSLKELLNELQAAAETSNLGTPYIVGGVPRDFVMGTLDAVNDIDITTGRSDINELAQLFAERVDGSSYNRLKDHSQVKIDGITFDFSTNFIYNNLPELKNEYSVDPGLVKEAYSRDFTINTLLMPLDLSKVIDVTGRGVLDIESKILDCPVDCNLSFRESPNRILRAIYYKAKYGLIMSDNVKNAIKNNLDLLSEVKGRYASELVNASLREDPNMLSLMLELGVLQYLPMTKYLTKLLLENKKILDVI